MTYNARTSAATAALVFSFLPGFGSTLASAEAAFATNSIAPSFQGEALVDDTGAADRIRLADRLRTLSQEIPAAACHLHNGIDVTANRVMLSESIEQVDVILDALLNGNPDLNVIGGEARIKTAREIETLMAEFAPLRDAGLAVLETAGNAQAAEVIFANSEQFLDLTTHLLSEIEAEYANPTEILQSDVMLLEISGRQAMATQRLAYEACMIWSGAASAVASDDMGALMTRFDASIRALQDGRPDLGIAAAPTDEIRVALDEVVVDWDQTSEALTQIMTGDDVPIEVAAFVSENLKTKMDELEYIVDLYTEYSRRVY